MSFRSALARFWRGLAKPREPLLHYILRRRATRRALEFDGPRAASEGGYYYKALCAYLALWLAATTQEEHYRIALERFGLDEEDVAYVDQILASAALGTLGNWIEVDDDPWWKAALHLTHSRERYLLNPLRWRLMERM